jgi:DNA-binding SARP family transcriptional activator
MMISDQVRNVVRFATLGPLVARRGEVELNLGPVQQRVVLAVLLLHPDQRMSREQLIDAVWGESVPTYAVNLLQKRISGLRKVLEAADPGGPAPRLLTWTDAGYRLSVPPGCLDLRELDELTRAARSARAAGDHTTAAEALHAALRLWRGPPFEGLSSPLLDQERERLAEQHIGLLEQRIEADLMVGAAAADLIIELRRLISEHPLRERLRGLLMLALYRSGRQAEALEAFREAHRHLRDELGVDPGLPLRRMHEQILTGDPRLGVPDDPGDDWGLQGHAAASSDAADPAVPRPGAGRGAHPAVPAELPRTLPDFVGRQDDIDSLDALLDRDFATDGRVAVVVISGTAGVGKTTLAVHWAHHIRERFPDGQLYVNLRGFAPTAPVEPGEAIRGFLDGLGVPAHRQPSNPESQAALYRSLLADRRVLILADNARDADQVRPLLPGGVGCLVIVTSRNELPGLVAMSGAAPLAVDLLSRAEARRLLDRRLGAARTAAEPRAVNDIIASCARLPLALTIAAARAASHPTFRLEMLAAELREIRGRLDAFDSGDPLTDIRAVFSASYQALSPVAARLFRLLGLHHGPDISTAAAASLAGLPPAAARRPLAELARAHLTTERMPGRYAFHDLLRAYATELAEEQDDPADRDAAVRRLLDHYLHTAAHAQQLLNPHHGEEVSLGSTEPGVTAERIAGHDSALSWFAAERATLLATMLAAGDAGIEPQSWQLICALTPFLEYQGYWHEWREALEMSRLHGDASCQALVRRQLGRANVRLGRYDESDRHLHAALDQYTTLDDLVGQAHAHRDLCWQFDFQGRHQESLHHAERALELFRAAGHRSGEGRALNAVGWAHITLGDPQAALDHCRAALEIQLAIEDRFGQAETWDSLGYAYRHLGDPQQATSCYRRALELYRDFGDRYNVADSLTYLGDAALAAGDVQQAVAAWREALVTFERLHHPDVDRVRAKLVALREAGESRTLVSAIDPP